MKNKIDFVILWVDGNDIKWQKKKEKFKREDGDKSLSRYRDWDNLKYWFRGVEKYAPWVNNIFFITEGHLPKWLNKNHPKLKIIKHENFIPTEYLPTFNSNVIELNLFRIKELSEKFVLFNDDVFIIKKTKPTDFFINSKPRDIYFEVNWDSSKENKIFASILQNNYKIINKNFNKKKVYKKNPLKYFNLKYGLINVLRTIKMLKKDKFIGINNPHLSQPFLKSEFKKVYEKEKESFINTFKNKFRKKTDISNYLIRYFNIMEGNFIPRGNIGKGFSVDSPDLFKYISKQQGKVVCLNDSKDNIDFVNCQKTINKSFEIILGEKSSYEKN